MTQVVEPHAEDKVADALRHSWVYWLPRWLWPFAQLARWERPIGWQLLMWPCWWSVTLALYAKLNDLQNQGINNSLLQMELMSVFPALLFAFFAGSFLMRGAGCTYNDLADVDIDNKVERTRSRPLPSGRVTKSAALIFLVLQALGGLLVLIYLARDSSFVFVLGASSLVLVAIYPFMKRITWWPQLFLGLAFSWGALMGWAAVWHELALSPLLLYAGSILWVIGYDTIYAHQDREDDALIGVKSTARLFGRKSKAIISGLYLGALGLFGMAFFSAFDSDTSVTWPAWLGLTAGAAHMLWQLYRLDIEDGAKCLKLFKSNSQFGLIVFAGLAVALMLG